MNDRGGFENATEPERVYRFGDFELDPVRETLNGPDGPVGLRDHALRVLKLLVERAPTVVSRDDILDEVWGHQALSESSIAQVIRDIRATLGDSARSATMVATRYGRGYQFVGQVERVRMDARASTRPSGETAPDQDPLRARRPRMLLVAVVAVLAVTGWQWFRGAPTLPTADAESITLRAVAPDSGETLSNAMVDYLAFLLGNAMGSGRVDVARSEADIDAADRVIEISLASLESGDTRQLELVMGPSATKDPVFRARFDEASELIQRGLTEAFETLEGQVDTELRLDAGLVSQSSYAIETLLRGMTAQFSGDVQRAAEMFEAALAEDPDFEFARYELAVAVRRNGEYERALAILEPMALRLTSDFWTHRINTALGIAYWRLDRYDAALAAMRRAEAAADSAALRAIVLNNISLIERNQGFLEEAETSSRLATRLAMEAESPRLEASSRNTLASILMRLDRIDEALGELGIARELFYQTGNLAGYGAVLSRTANIHDARGERAETESLLRLALGVREQIGDEDGVADIQLRLARLHRIRGEFEQARALARDGLDRALALGEDDLVIDGYQALATLALAEGRHDPARTYGNEALRLAELTGRERDQRAVRHGLLHLDLLTDAAPLGEIEEKLEQLIAEADDAEHRLIRIRARLLASELYRSQQRAEDARRVLERAETLLEAGDLRLRYEVDAEQARLAILREDFEAADRALDSLERNNAPAHPSLTLRARLQAAQGNLTSAIETAGLARATIGDWWTPEHQDELDAWSAELSG